jgi:hypothetical protein
MDNIPLYFKELVTEKRRARNRRQRTRSNEERLNFNRLRRKLHNTLKNITNSSFEHYITSLFTNDHSIWKATKKIQNTTNTNSANKDTGLKLGKKRQ